MSRSPDLAEDMANDPVLALRYYSLVPESDGKPETHGDCEGRQFKDGPAWKAGKLILYVWLG